MRGPLGTATGRTIPQEPLCVRGPLGAATGRTIPQELLCVRGPLGTATGRSIPREPLCVRVPLGAAIGRPIPQEPLCVRVLLALPQGGASLCRSFRATPSSWPSAAPRVARAGGAHTGPSCLAGGCLAASVPSSPASLPRGARVSCSAMCVGCFAS